ncbi:hypothetical protein DY138_07085 [Apilactobacillus timberlakei]|uniref:DUF5776 domain-containing protein n=1 Tax=Apilactobacillus timberlakei TaxID=2008380 RepID=UPI00112D0BCD|nr:DUF5776 domain-containing protein [Apilactobacillus timberlakei]TPR17660.1 hypothetical protein DY138_07085 [Apilactobacillus timberlakei]TPR19473.1 hypothetical protein DY061_06990 [Apilactobacillus timberlakei]TPR20851.1 hypothetical protein DY083_07485 [Apilactobacillus timberlakei]
MQYNKNQFNKVNDKKVMKKVKKQWVVVSVATLALLGGGVATYSGISNISGSVVVAHAAEAKTNTHDTSGNSSAVNQPDATGAKMTSGSPQSGTPSSNPVSSAYTGSVNAASDAISTDSGTASSASQTTSGVANSMSDHDSGGQVKQDSNVANTASGAVSGASNSVSKYSNAASSSNRDNSSKEADSANSAKNVSSSAASDAKDAASDATNQSNGYSLASSANNDSQQASNSANSANNNFASLSNQYSCASSANVINNSLGSAGRENDYSNANNYYNSISTKYNDALSKANAINGSGSSSGASYNLSSANSAVQSDWNAMNSVGQTQLSTAGQSSMAAKSAFDVSKYNDEQSSAASVSSSSIAISNASSAIATDSSNASAAYENLKRLVEGSEYIRTVGANDAWSQIQAGGSSASPSMSSSNASNSAYADAFNGVRDAWNKYNGLNKNVGTQGVQDYTGTTASNPNDPNSVDPFLNSGKSSVQRYYDNKKAQIPNDPNGENTNQSADNNINAGTIYSNVNDYNSGITYFLAHQGTADAESGKWSGRTKNDTYNPESTSKNAYDQAYLGAQYAISKEWTDDNQLNYSQPSNFSVSTNNNNDHYKLGISDVVNKVKAGTAFISNPTQFNNAIYFGGSGVCTGNTTGNYVSYNTYDYNGTIKNVSFIQDISWQSTQHSTYTGGSKEHNNFLHPTNSSFSLTYDGQNHIVDFGSALYSINSNMKSVNVQNFSTIYGTNFYGPFKFEGGVYGQLNYSNVTYVGSQMSQAAKSDVNVYNKLNVFSVGQYKNAWGQSSYTEASGSNLQNGHASDDQQNFEVNNFTMKAGSSYYGSTSGGNAIELSGNLTLENGSKITLVPLSAYGPEHSGGVSGVSTGLDLTGTNSMVYVSPNATMNIKPTSDANYGGVAQGLYIYNGNVVVDGGTINIDVDGPTTSNNNNNTINGNVTVKNSGYFNINGKTLGNYSGSLLYISSSNSLNISNRGNLYVETDGTGSSSLNLINNAGTFNVDNPGDNVTLKIDNNNGQNGNLFTQPINAYSVRYSLKSDADLSSPKYRVYVPNNGYIQYIDPATGNTMVDDTNANINGIKYLTFKATPNAYFNGRIRMNQDSSGINNVSGQLYVANVPTSSDDGHNKIYIQVNYDGTNLLKDSSNVGSFALYDSSGKKIKDISVIPHAVNNQIIKVSGSNNSRVTKGDVTYTDSIAIDKDSLGGVDLNSDQYRDSTIRFNYKLPNGTPTNDVSVLANYYVTQQKQTLGMNGSFKNELINPTNPNGGEIIDQGTDTSLVTKYTPTLSGAQEAGASIGANDYDSSKSSDPKNSDAWNNIYKNQNPDIQNAFINYYSNGFKGANAGFINSMKKGSSEPNDNNPSEKTGYDYGTQSIAGANSSQLPSDSSANPTAQQDGFKIAQQAKDDAAKAGAITYDSASKVQVPKEITDVSNSPKALIYQSAYYGASQANKTKNASLSNSDQVSQNAFDRQKGAIAFTNGDAKPTNDVQSQGYQDTQSGYQAAIKSNPNDASVDSNKSTEYNQGIADGNKVRQGYQEAENNGNPQSGNYSDDIKDSQSNKDAYDGVADAINTSKQQNTFDHITSGSGKKADYVNAYNTAIDGAKASNDNGSQAFLNNGSSTTDQGSNAEKSVYTNAYNDTQKGYQEGLKTPAPTQDQINAMKPNEKTGYETAKNLASGYQKAIDDYYKNGIKSEQNIPSDNTPGYQEAIKGLIDGKGTDNQPANNKPLYEIARAESSGTSDGINKAKTDNSSSDVPSDSDIPAGVNKQAYQDAYQAAHDGYTKGASGQYDDTKKNNPVYTNAFDQGSQQKGADDYLNGSVKSPDNTNGQNYTKGVDNAKAAFDKAFNGNDDNLKDAASQAGDQAGKNAKNGYDEASDSSKQAPTLNNDKSNQNEVDAYWGAKTGANNGETVPSGVNTNSPSYQSAEQKAQSQAAQGAQQYLNDKQNGDKTEPSGNDALYNQGYNNQKAYDAGFNNSGDNEPDQTNWTKGHKNAYQAGKDASKQGYEDAKSNKTDPDNAANAGATQGFNDAKNGQPFNPSNNMPAYSGTDKNNKQMQYQSSYAKAYAEASDQMNKGAQQYVSDKNSNKSTASKPVNPNDSQDTQAFNQGYDNQKAYDTGFNNNTSQNPSEDGWTDSQKQAYQNGQKAKNAIPNAAQAVVNGKDVNRPGDNEKDAQASYDGAKAAYEDAANGKDASGNIGKSANYQQAYNKAYGDMQQAKSNGTKDFFNQVQGDNLNNADAINKAKSSDNGTGIDDKVRNNAFAEQQGYAARLVSDSNNNPYTNNPNKTSYDDGFNKASGDIKAGYQAAQAASNPSPSDNPIKDASGNDIKTQGGQETYRAAAQAFQDVKDGKPQADNNDKTSTYQMAYNMAYNVDQSAKHKGSQDFLNDPSSTPNNTYSGGQSTLYNQGNDYSKNGYNSVMNPNNSSSDGQGSKEYIDGANLANNLLNGVKAAASGSKTAPAGTEDGFNTANAAIKQAITDSQNGTNQGSDGKLDPSKIIVPNNIPKAASQAYKDVYEGAYKGYQNGYNGGSAAPDKSDPKSSLEDYIASYSNAYKQGQSNMPMPSPQPQPQPKPTPQNNSSTAPTDFLNGKPKTNFTSDAEKQAYQKAYNNTKNGVQAALKNEIRNSDGTKYYDDGYKAGTDGLAGMKAAQKGIKDHTQSGNKSYINGYNGYDAGKKAAKQAVYAHHNISNKGVIYSYAYKQAFKQEERHQNNLGLKQGIASAKKYKALPANFAKKHSQAFVKAYMSAYRHEIKRSLPRYIYNTKSLFTHNSIKFTKHNRIKKYAKQPRHKAHIFRVTGVGYSKTGLPRYRVNNKGYVTSRPDYVANAYYQHNFKTFKIIKPSGALVHSGKRFHASNVVKKLNKNDVFKVNKIVKLNGITRFYIGKGEYITSNKTYVNQIKH